MALNLDEIKGLQKFLNRSSLAGAEFEQFAMCRRALEREALNIAVGAGKPAQIPVVQPPETAGQPAAEQDTTQR